MNSPLEDDGRRGTGRLDLFLHVLRKSGALRPWTAPLVTGDLPNVDMGDSKRYVSGSWLFRFRNGMSIEVIFQPGKQLVGHFDRVIADLHRLLRMNSDLHPGGFTHRQLQDLGYGLCVLRHNSRVVGFASSSLLGQLDGHPVLFLGSACVDRSVKSRSWAYLLNLLPITRLVLRRPWSFLYVASRTSSPRVLGFVTNVYFMFPRPLHATPDPVLALGAFVARTLSPHAHYERDAMTLRGVRMPDPGFRPPDRHHDPLINAYCDDLLDYAAGDAFILGARFDVPALLRSVCRYWRSLRRSRRSA